MEERKSDNLGAQPVQRKRRRIQQSLLPPPPPSIQIELLPPPTTRAAAGDGSQNSQASTAATVTPPRTHATVSSSASTTSAYTKKTDGILFWLGTLPTELFDPISHAYVKFWYADGKPTFRSLINNIREHDEASVVMLLSRRDYVLSNNNVDFVHGGDDHDWTPLHFASLYGSSNEIIELLIDCGADIRKKNSLGQTAVHRAIRSRNIRIVKLLLDHLSALDVSRTLNMTDQNGLKALHHAAMFADEAMLRLLIKRYGAFVDIGFDRKTPLHSAIEQNNKQTISALLECGADIQRENKLNGKNSLHYAVERGDEEIVEMILMESSANSKPCSGRKRRRDDIDKTEFIDRSDSQGRSPLIWAVHRGHERIVQLLLKNGADINYRTRLLNQTALHFVSIIGREMGSGGGGGRCFCCCESMMRLLADNGADVNAQDSNGETPLHYLSKRQSKELVVRLLVELYGANVTLQNKDGFTAADTAETSLGSSNPISQILRQHLANGTLADTQVD